MHPDEYQEMMDWGDEGENRKSKPKPITLKFEHATIIFKEGSDWIRGRRYDFSKFGKLLSGSGGVDDDWQTAAFGLYAPIHQENNKVSKPFRNTIIERIRKDPEYKAEVLREIVECLSSGDFIVAKTMLNNVIEAEETNEKTKQNTQKYVHTIFPYVYL
jgi:hypothetical protein